ncbi:MAG TPA: hypothetical protein VE931_11680 [Pyrinomonadaceae bacterium]|nr:hypothetical protein [Pyrinomonadaceae bacterium]
MVYLELALKHQRAFPVEAVMGQILSVVRRARFTCFRLGEIAITMKSKQPTEFENFDKIMGGLLSVPYSELQKKLEEEKQAKQKKKRATSPASSRASSSRKKRVA